MWAAASCFAAAVLAFPLLETVGTASPAPGVTLLDQGWDDDLRQRYYYTPQGSLLIPLRWLLALERTDGPGRLTDPEYLSRFGWIYHEGARPDLNPAGLPIGFAVDPAGPQESPWVGLTCAACHTSEMAFNGTRIRVDGGPSNLDFDVFYAALAGAVRATLLSPDPARFQRFAEAVLGPGHSPEAAGKLKSELALFEAKMSGDAAIRRPSVPSGFGRVDALNQILNAIAVRDLGVPENLRPVDAPVSYPHLWLTPKLDWVQWNPVASNPLARNVGEVLGVFGSTNLQSINGTLFQSTALLPQLIDMENWLNDLKSPRWPEDLLPPIDATKAEAGRALFERDCAGCHNMPPFRMTRAEDNIARQTFIRVGRIPAQVVGTDMVYVRSFQSRTVATGALAPVLFESRPIVSGGEFFVDGIRAVIRKELSELSLTPAESLAASGFRFHARATPDEPLRDYEPTSPCEKANCLKAGVLLGTWATGPFLHNGSVPTIYELLSPPEQRRKLFWVGGRELDEDRLGFVSGWKTGLFRYDTSQPGNGNGGHVFPVRGYSHDERLAVIEYLKDPNRFAPKPHL